MKHSGILRILAVALTLALLILAIPATPALAQAITLSPASGMVGTWVYVYGTGFTAQNGQTLYIFFDYTYVAPTTVVSGGTFTAYFTVPTVTAGIHVVTVQHTTTTYTPANQIGSPAYFTVMARQITMSPTSGYVGDQITVYGTGFTGGSTVTVSFDGTVKVTTTATTYGTFSAVFTVPESCYGIHTVTAQDGSGYYATASFTTYSKVTVSPATAAVGDKITVSGTGFAASQSVTIYFDDETAGSATTNSLGTFTSTTFTVPASYWGSHTIRAQDASGYYAAVTFSTKQSTTLSPTSGPVGTKVTITGNGFNANTTITITFDDAAVTTATAAVTTDSKGSFSTSFNIPASSGGTHQVKASDGTNTDTRTFTVSASSSVSPTSGYVGTKVTVNGSGFYANVSVSILFDNVLVKSILTDAKGSFSTSFEVPARGAGTYKIRATDGANIKDTDFTVLTSATISPVTSTASPGYVGTLVTVNGIGFMPNRTLTITYDGQQVATGIVGSDGSFSVTFNAPASGKGAHTVTANDGTNSIPLTFVMEATPPPVPGLLKPESGTKAKALAVFDWAAVTDPSNVTYTLQIATDAEFTKIVLEKKLLTQSEYTLTKDEKLESVSKKTPYYWRVKAIDGASNESNWSSAGSFYVGFIFSQQTLIYIIIGIGAVILVLLAFWVGTRRAARLV